MNITEGVVGHESPFVVTTRKYSSGLIEHTGYFLSRSDFAEPGPRKKRRTGDEMASDGVVRDERAVRASKAALRRLIYSFGPDRMLTLTFRENVTEFDDAKRAWDSFAKGWKKYFPESPVVAVPERQLRGAWHFHCAILGFHDLRTIHKIWRHGAVNMRRGKRSGVSRYLAKYMGKDLALLGRSAYRVIARKYIDKPHKTTVRMFLKSPGEYPLWVFLEARFSHLALAYFAYGGVYWRLSNHGSDEDSSSLFSKCHGYGGQGGL
jgi:hypothetical protein